MTLGPEQPALAPATMAVMSAALAYVAGAVVAAWGIAHAIPTRQVLAGFEPVTADNRRIIAQEWLAEAFTMWGIAVVVITTTAVGGIDPGARGWIYRAMAGLLTALAILTALTGARTRIIWFKICPVLLACSAVLLLIASTA